MAKPSATAMAMGTGGKKKNQTREEKALNGGVMVQENMSEMFTKR